MDIIRKNTLMLLKSALFGAPPSIDKLSEGEWETIYDYSKDQSVTALCFESITKLPEELRPSRSLYFHWAMFSEQTEIKYREKKQRLAKFLQLIGDNPKVLIIKGFSLARNYPVPSHRWCGDVDIFCFEQSENVDRIMEASGIEVDYSNPRHSMFRIDGLKFENHRYFLYNRKESEEKEFELFLQREAEGCCHQSDSQIVLGTPMGNAVFFLKHTEEDFVFSRQNIKLRALCDWTTLLNAGEVDYSELKKQIKGTSLERFADTLITVSVKYLGLSPDFLKNFEPIPQKIVDDFLFMALNYQNQVELRGTLKGKMDRLLKYLRHYNTYKYLFDRNIIRWYYFSK
ncbi:MAG: nucleotidyltransferase family protein [Bacteroidales bacterium]|nr:nucleotidyltransferase family protein [Bacteroidales bacterium]